MKFTMKKGTTNALMGVFYIVSTIATVTETVYKIRSEQKALQVVQNATVGLETDGSETAEIVNVEEVEDFDIYEK